MASQVYVNGTTLTDSGEFNRFDTAAYPVLYSVTGTNAIAATGPANYTLNASSHPLVLVPAFTNTSTVTVTVTPAGSSALSTVALFANGVACVGGELQANVPVLIQPSATRFNIVGPTVWPASYTSSIGADVALSTTGEYFDGPSVAQGTVGKWFASGTVTLADTSSIANMLVKLWDGTSVIASAYAQIPAANGVMAVSLSGLIQNPAGNIRISARDLTTTNGVMFFSNSANGKDSTVSAVRIG